LSRRGTRVTALDISGAMCAYARRRSREEKVDLDVVRADMTEFHIPPPRFDLAFVMLDSASHLLDLDAMVDHLRAVAAHLGTGGLYIMEMSHPAEALPGGAPTQDRWQVTVGGRRLSVRWTTAGYDPVTQIADNRIAVTIVENGSRRVVRDRITLRRWTPTELDAAVRLAGRLDVVARHGSFEHDAGFGQRAGKGEWRMISVIERR
jgi:SAM-dependent methyltransferase